MKIAYMIQAHKNYNQTINLINRLLDKDTDIYIHIDKKSEILFEKLNLKFSNNKKVNLIKDRVSVNWGGFSQVQATINMMKSIYSSKKKYDYVSLISGQHYPIKSNSYIKKYLHDHNGLDFIEFNDIGEYDWRIKGYHLYDEPFNKIKYIDKVNSILRVLQKKIKLKKFNNLYLYKGSQWFTITYGSMEYILDYINNNKKIYNKFKFTTCSDEHFFQIVLLNSPNKNRIVNSNLTHIKWSGKSSPEILKKEDLNYFIESDSLFARKFDIDIDKSILEEIDLFILN